MSMPGTKKNKNNPEKEMLKQSLLKLAAGYEYEEKQVIVDKNGVSSGKVKVTKKHVPPDLGAIRVINMMIQNGDWD